MTCVACHVDLNKIGVVYYDNEMAEENTSSSNQWRDVKTIEDYKIVMEAWRNVFGEEDVSLSLKPQALRISRDYVREYDAEDLAFLRLYIRSVPLT